MSNSQRLLEGRTSSIAAWLGFFVMIIVAFSTFMVLTSQVMITDSFDAAGLVVPTALFIPSIAALVYWHQWHVSLHRPNTLFYKCLDLFGSLLGLGVVTFAGLSLFIPPVSLVVHDWLRLPAVQYNLLNVVLIISFGIGAWWDILVNHWWRAVITEQARTDDDSLTIKFDVPSMDRMATLMGEKAGNQVAEQLKPALDQLEIVYKRLLLKMPDTP